MLRTSGSPPPTVTRPAFRGTFCCRRIGRFTPAMTGDSRPQEVEAVDLRPLVAGAVDHALKQRLNPPAPHQWLAASGRDSPGLSDKDGDGAGELSTHWA